MSMRIVFQGGAKVAADYHGFLIETDQPEKYGGTGTAAAPFDHFLASLGTCAAFYIQKFCQSRDISTEGIELNQSWTVDPDTRLITDIKLELHLPDDFPEKYKSAVIRASEQCSVKKTIEASPHIETVLV
jgi:ribosomal protein S12 methylthiotransferase accessory factor